MSKTAIVWSCAHADPEVSNERFDWLSRLIQDIKPDYTVDLGDGADMRSLNSYDTRSPKAIISQNYEADIEAYNESQDRLWGPYKLSKKKRPYRFGFEGNHECFQGFTEILTKEKGWVPVTDVTPLDEVMTLSGWEQVEKTHKLPFKGYMVNLNSRGQSFAITPNHRVYYYTTNRKLLVKPAKDTPKEFDVPVATTNNFKGSALTDDQLRLCAIALTDSYHKNSALTLYQSGIKAEVFRGLLQRLNLPYREVVRDRDITHICGVELKTKPQVSYEFHLSRPDWCPDQNLTIPKELFNLTQAQADIFLETLLFCDGSSFSDRVSTVFYGKKQICDDVQAFCQMHGSRAFLTEYRKNQWRVNINPRDKLRVKKSIGPYVEDWVYCLTVPSGNFLARQGNFSMFTGNCRITKALSLDPRLEGVKYGISFKHLQTDHWFDEYHEYENSAPAIVDINGILHSHFFSAGNFGTAMSGLHHGYGLLNKLNRSAICGHSHKRSLYFKDSAYPKPIIGMVVGCFKGKEEAWAGQANRDWWKGVVIMRDIDGGCFDPEFVSMERLQKAYG